MNEGESSEERHTFLCKDCGRITLITREVEIRCARCGSKSGTYAPLAPGDRPGSGDSC